MHPSPRPWLKHPLRFLSGQRQYRCETCAARFWINPVHTPVRESCAQEWPTLPLPDDAPDVELDLKHLDAILDRARTDPEWRTGRAGTRAPDWMAAGRSRGDRLRPQ